MLITHRQRLIAPAKINLGLRVVGRDKAGFHKLETLFQTLELADAIDCTCRPGPALTRMSCDDPSIPVDEGNLLMRAVAALRQTGLALGEVRLHLRKRIPAGGGLGGGSADAAALLRHLGRGLSAPQLAEIALGLGSDIPFFLLGGTAHGSGRGDQLTPLPDLPPTPVTLLLPGFGCSTPAVFRALCDGERAPRSLHGPGPWKAHWLDHLANDLAPAALRVAPELATTLKWIEATGLPGGLSGSGSTAYVLSARKYLPEPPPGVRLLETAFRPRWRLGLS